MRKSIPHTCLSASGPAASIGNGVRMTASGATSSSIVLKSNSTSPVLAASWKRLNVALLSSGVDIRLLRRGLLLDLSEDFVRDVGVGVDVLHVVAVFERVDELHDLARTLRV